jgi:hypothetical protein
MKIMIDLTKLEYGKDYFVLPPTTIVYDIPYLDILTKLGIDEIIDGENKIKRETDTLEVIIKTKNFLNGNKGFDFKIKKNN